MILRDFEILCLLMAGMASFACRARPAPDDRSEQASASSATASARPSASATPAASGSSAKPAPTQCPEGMLPVPGGRFWVGSADDRGTGEESPRFETEIAPFCLDRTEVTVEAYRRCVEKGDCKAGHSDRRFCNVNWEGRGQHPINCVDWHQADTYCKVRGARLPTEFEWEFAARGGAEYRKYPWGDAPPNGHTCWNHPGGSCEVGTFPVGAFGLHDITGNVWEWTESWYGKYPWPPLHARHKVYRGGSWSRRFEKWMRPRLRNRWRPDAWGSHLGFRCALTLPGTPCPFGPKHNGEAGCLHGVTQIDCPAGRPWNGARCAPKGAPKCAEGRREEPGHGCVLVVEVSGKAPEVDLSGVTRSRSAQFDADCHQHYPGRPHAYRYSGGTHHARNVVSRQAGCSNRDVGVGWNSCCCP
jgi:formylglycine-generating enzyme required for sulfatase activity